MFQKTLRITLADKLQPNSADVYTFLSINDFHSPMSVDRKYICPLQKSSITAHCSIRTGTTPCLRAKVRPLLRRNVKFGAVKSTALQQLFCAPKWGSLKQNKSHNSSASFRITLSEGTKQGDVFRNCISTFLKYESINVQENPARLLQRNGSLQVLTHADDNYLQDENMKSTAKKCALIARKPRGPEPNAVEIKYMFEE